MKFFRRLKTKYGIAHPLCMLSLLACLCLCAGIILYTLINYEDTNALQYAEITENVSSDAVLLFGEELFDTIIQSYSQVIAIGIEPFLAVIVHGFAGLVNAMIGLPFNIEATMFSVPHILLITIVICSIGKLMQCFECTRSFAMLTYGEFERIFGYILMVYIACQNVIKIMYVCEKHRMTLNAVFEGMPVEIIVGLLVFIIGVLTSFSGILFFYVTKTLVLGLQIMQLSISFFPFTSMVFEVMRSSITIAVAVFNLLFPKVGFAFNCAAVVVGCILLTQTSSSVEYFRVIYIETLLLPYYRFKGSHKLLYKDVPTEIRKRCKNSDGIIVPVFSIDKFNIKGIEVASHEKWWLEITEDALQFYRKRIFSKKVECFTLSMEERNWYYKDNWRYLELFDLNGPDENIIKLFKKPERELSFAVSREYEVIFKDITANMHAVDYNALKARLTEERKHYIEQENKAFYAAIQ